MNIPLHWLKTGLAMLGLGLFLLGIRFGMDPLRWTGIGVVAVAWLLRFLRRAPQSASASTSPSEDQ